MSFMDRETNKVDMRKILRELEQLQPKGVWQEARLRLRIKKKKIQKKYIKCKGVKVRPRLPSPAHSLPSWGHQHKNSRHESEI
jgi:hypothetical protein